MQESFVKSTVYDMTGGLQPAPADDGYNIAMPVYTPTGPIEKTKVLSQKDFIDKYMTGVTMFPNDHMSALFAYMVLAQNPVYITRACPCAILEGISSTGNHYLFDRDFNLIPSYKRWGIEKISDSMTYFAVNDGTKDYYTGTGDTSAGAVAIADNKSIAKLLTGLKDKAPSLGVISASDSSIELRTKLTSSANFAKFEEVEHDSVYHLTTAPGTSAAVNAGDYLAINGVTYWYNNGATSVPNMPNPTEITWPVSGSAPDAMNAGHFLLEVLAHSGSKFIGSLTFAISGATVSDWNVEGTSNSSNDITFTSNSAVTTKTLGDLSLSLAGDSVNGIYVASEISGWVANDHKNFAGSYILDLGTGSTRGASGITDPGDIATWKVHQIQDSGALDDGVTFTLPATPNVTLTINSASVKFICSKDKVNSNILTLFQAAESCSLIINPKATTLDMLKVIIDQAIIKESAATEIITTSANSIQVLTPMKGSLEVGGTWCNINTDTENNPTYIYYTSSDDNNEDELVHPFVYVVIGDYFYYAGRESDAQASSFSQGKTLVQMSKSGSSKNEFINLLDRYLFSTQKVSCYNGYYIFTDTNIDIAVCQNPMITEKAGGRVVAQNPVEQFAIVQKFPSTSASFQFSYNKNKDNDEILDLTLNYKGGVSTETWTMSFVPGVVDGYQVDQWYTRVNSEYFQIVKFDGTDLEDSFVSDYYGNLVKVPEYNDQYMIDAISELPNYEDGLHYDIVSDAGVASPVLGAAIQSLATQLYAVYPASIPAEYTNVNDVIAFKGDGYNHYEVRLLAAGDRIGVAGFSKPFPGSYKLILQMINRFRNPATEFAPNFDLANGSVGMTNIIQTWKKADREKLLDYQIESLKGGINTAYYINDNVTAQPSKSYMSEDQNVRMTNTAVHIIEDYVKQFIGQLNTTALRSKVQDGCNNAIQARLFNGKVYTPVSYYAVCDDSNNTVNTINRNELIVSLYATYSPSIKRVLVYHYILPLAQNS